MFKRTVENIVVKLRVKPSKSIDKQQMSVPPIMYGRRRPNLDFVLSAITP